MLKKVLHGENQSPPFFIFLTWYEEDAVLNLQEKLNFHITNIATWLNSETSCPNCLPIYIYIYIYIFIYIYIIYIFSQIVHRNPYFNLFMLHNNQGSEIKNNMFLRFNILPFTETFFLLPKKVLLPSYY